MDNVKSLSVSKSNEIKKTSGLTSVIGYEPWHIRTIESCKHSLIDGQPLLFRIHSGASYPCSTNSTSYKLDMESHAVLLVGFDDETEMFDIIDPWQKDWEGSNNGIRKLPYELLPIVCVNATKESITRLSLPYKNVQKTEGENDNASLILELGFYLPKGYIIDQSQNYFTEFDIALNYKKGNEEISYYKRLKGNWSVGEFAKTIIPLTKGLDGNVEFDFKINALIKGNRPYDYTDNLHFEFSENLQFVAFEKSITKENKKII